MFVLKSEYNGPTEHDWQNIMTVGLSKYIPCYSVFLVPRMFQILTIYQMFK